MTDFGDLIQCKCDKCGFRALSLPHTPHVGCGGDFQAPLANHAREKAMGATNDLLGLALGVIPLVVFGLTVWLLSMLLGGCQPEQGQPLEDPAPYTPPAPIYSDAEFICDTLTQCFGLDLGPCAADLEATTTPADLAQCANCYAFATCEDIGAPGVAGVCDNACHAALFESTTP